MDNMHEWQLDKRIALAEGEIRNVLKFYGLIQDAVVEKDAGITQRNRLVETTEGRIETFANPQWKPPLDDEGHIHPDYVEAITGQRPDYAPERQSDPLPDDGTPAPEVLPFPQEESA